MLSSRPVPLGMEPQIHPSKTPGRLKGRIENAVSTTVHGKGKEVGMRTPFHAGTQNPLKDPVTTQTQGKPVVATTRPTRPLGDKTPFPNRGRPEQFETPLPKLSKFPVLSLLEPQTHLHANKTPDSLLRPSSARKHVRVPRSASKSFETPLNNGNHWDVSDSSIILPEASVQETLPEDDYDEIEYMPPNNLDLPYQPPFDFELPNYKEVGKTLWNLAHSYPQNDYIVPEVEVHPDDVQLLDWNMLLPLRELESDDPFRQTAGTEGPAVTLPSKPGPQARAVAKGVKPVATTSRPAPVARSATATRAPSSAALNSTRSIPTRLGTSNSAAPSIKPAQTKTHTAGSAAPRITRAPIIPKPRTIDLGKTAAASRTAKSSGTSVSAIPSRPATSTATRSRVASSTVTTASVRRPATSTSSYRTTAASVPSRSLATTTKFTRVSRERLAVEATAKKSDAGSSDMILLVDGGTDLVEDFLFDV